MMLSDKKSFKRLDFEIIARNFWTKVFLIYNLSQSQQHERGQSRCQDCDSAPLYSAVEDTVTLSQALCRSEATLNLIKLHQTVNLLGYHLGGSFMQWERLFVLR